VDEYQLGKDIGRILARLAMLEQQRSSCKCHSTSRPLAGWYCNLPYTCGSGDTGTAEASGPTQDDAYNTAYSDAVFACTDFGGLDSVGDPSYEPINLRAAHSSRRGSVLIQTPATVGVPVVRTQADVDFAMKHGFKGDHYKKPGASRPFTRHLYGNGLILSSTGLWYWYSNSDSSDACGTSNWWHSGKVIQTTKLGSCPGDGLPSWEITVSD